jgi:TonB family protein
VTIATPGYADGSVRSETTAASNHFHGLSGRDQAEEAGLALLEEGVQENDLLGSAGRGRQAGYWKLLQSLLHQRLRDELVPLRLGPARRMPIIHFRLYANGEAQLIEVERTSGNSELDQAALLSIVKAHPFPPFPGGSSESPVDVHVDLPVLTR